jgi:hypothetical protein
MINRMTRSNLGIACLILVATTTMLCGTTSAFSVPLSSTRTRHAVTSTSYPGTRTTSTSNFNPPQSLHKQNKSHLNLNLNLNINNNNNDNQEENNEKKNDLDTFRLLMGTLYGIAGIAHAFDCFIGPSQLLLAAGYDSFYELSSVGQFVAIIWCLVGPLAFILSSTSINNASSNSDNEDIDTGVVVTGADIGLVLYGLVEVGGAAFAPNDGTLLNAFLVQVVVFASWVYSSSRQKENVAQ